MFEEFIVNKLYSIDCMVTTHIHLQILEATVPPTAPPPAQFQQSLQVLNAEGRPVRYEMTSEGCSFDPEADPG